MDRGRRGGRRDDGGGTSGLARVRDGVVLEGGVRGRRGQKVRCDGRGLGRVRGVGVGLGHGKIGDEGRATGGGPVEVGRTGEGGARHLVVVGEGDGDGRGDGGHGGGSGGEKKLRWKKGRSEKVGGDGGEGGGRGRRER